jgi:hypothetical protein
VQELLHLQRLEFLLYLIVDILVPGETRTYVKTDTNTWSIEGNQGSNNEHLQVPQHLSTTSIGSITLTIGFLSGIK